MASTRKFSSEWKALFTDNSLAIWWVRLRNLGTKSPKVTYKTTKITSLATTDPFYSANKSQARAINWSREKLVKTIVILWFRIRFTSLILKNMKLVKEVNLIRDKWTPPYWTQILTFRTCFLANQGTPPIMLQLRTLIMGWQVKLSFTRDNQALIKVTTFTKTMSRNNLQTDSPLVIMTWNLDQEKGTSRFRRMTRHSRLSRCHILKVLMVVPEIIMSII